MLAQVIAVRFSRVRNTSSMELMENAFVVVTLFLFSDALVLQLRREAGYVSGEAQGDPVLQIAWFVIYGITFCLVALEYRRFASAFVADKWLAALVVIGVCSIAWSPAPAVTVRRATALIGTTAFGVYLAVRYSWQEWIRLLSTALGLIAVLSLVFVVLLPEYGIHQGDVHDGLWRGVFTGKNHLGRVMALGVTTNLLTALGDRRLRGRFAVMTGLSLLLLFKSGSMTALVAVGATCLALMTLLLVRLPASMAFPGVLAGGVAAVGAGVWVMSHLSEFAVLLGRDLTFTGRVPLWLAVWERILERPLLGYGFGTFWIDAPATTGPIWSVTKALNNWMPISAHNGFLELTLAVGGVGLALFIMGFSAAVVRCVAWVRSQETALALWPVAFLTLLLMANVGESSLFRQNNVYWAVYVALCASTTVSLTSAHTGRRRGDLKDVRGHAAVHV